MICLSEFYKVTVDQTLDILLTGRRSAACREIKGWVSKQEKSLTAKLKLFRSTYVGRITNHKKCSRHSGGARIFRLPRHSQGTRI